MDVFRAKIIKQDKQEHYKIMRSSYTMKYYANFEKKRKNYRFL